MQTRRPCARPMATLALALALGLLMGGMPRPQVLAEGRSLAGQFLVAAPEMPDPRFARTVIYMIRHDESGAMGIVVNRPLGELALAELARGFGGDGEGVSGATVVHSGGPVEPQYGFVVHTAEVRLDSSVTVAPEVAVTSQPEILRALGGGAAPRRWLFVIGYAGWAPGQLEAELGRDDWFTLPYDEELLFDGDAATKWERALARRSIEL